MGIKKSVFASRAERAHYYKLARTWGQQYQIYHNLPFLHIFTPHDLRDTSDPHNPISFQLTNREFAQLKKTSVDYVLCDSADHPLLCIDFDGMQQGFNVGTTYHPDTHIPPDPWRHTITELKLRVAAGSRFPYFVVSSTHFDDITSNVTLTIVDGIIGEVLAAQSVHTTLRQGFDPEARGWSQEDFDRLSAEERQDMVQDWVLGVEVEADMRHNPIVRTRWSDTYTSLFTSYSTEFVQYPPVEMHASLKERAQQIDAAIRQGARVTIHTPDLGDLQTTVWLPNFQVVPFSGLSLAEDSAVI